MSDSLIKQRAERAKGVRLIKILVSITPEQREWLTKKVVDSNTVTNMSEIIRGYITKDIKNNLLYEQRRQKNSNVEEFENEQLD